MTDNRSVSSTVDGQRLLATGSVNFTGMAVVANANVPLLIARTLVVEGDPSSVLWSSEGDGVAAVANLKEGETWNGSVVFTMPDDRRYRLLYTFTRQRNPETGHFYSLTYTFTDS